MPLDLLDGRERGHLHAGGEHQRIAVTQVKALPVGLEVLRIERSDGVVADDLKADWVADLDPAILDVPGDEPRELPCDRA